MNHIQRRLFRVFAEAGGDLSEDEQVERFIRYVEGRLVLLPPRLREAVEFTWRRRDETSYNRLAAEFAHDTRRPLSGTALRQRLSRGVRLLEDAVRHRSWSSGGTSPSPARRGNGSARA